MCSRLLHSYCLEKYLKTQDKCPACRKHWTEKTSLLPIAQELQIIHDQNRDNSMDSDMDDDEPIPGTSSGKTLAQSRNYC